MLRSALRLRLTFLTLATSVYHSPDADYRHRDAIHLDSAATINRVIIRVESFLRKETGRHPLSERCTSRKTRTRLDEVSYNHQSIISARLPRVHIFLPKAEKSRIIWTSSSPREKTILRESLAGSHPC